MKYISWEQTGPLYHGLYLTGANFTGDYLNGVSCQGNGIYASGAVHFSIKNSWIETGAKAIALDGASNGTIQQSRIRALIKPNPTYWNISNDGTGDLYVYNCHSYGGKICNTSTGKTWVYNTIVTASDNSVYPEALYRSGGELHALNNVVFGNYLYSGSSVYGTLTTDSKNIYTLPFSLHAFFHVLRQFAMDEIGFFLAGHNQRGLQLPCAVEFQMKHAFGI